ncbi:hypothetical protein PILCRDRAFT_816555 [Piloderma croceum F 1598]|uniref:Protein CPL1-like domain-containing protein n=1 Tax=Piloderma croceum (strain F 1598) TaxID=765440 RepID=A0A0C3G2B2_PILCF|nr:hypothetical protein PILCRDRAFT_816555 [Piloderma croceum F 1598]
MTIANRFRFAFLLIAAALPYASAQVSARGESSCKSSDFWFSEKECCLPLGGPRWHRQPPAHKQCPHDWSWSTKHGHCVPHHPPPEHHPTPQCAKDWNWSPASFCCERPPHHPEPSNGVSHGEWKRSSYMSRALQLCPKGVKACPIAAPSGLTGDYECLDTAHELESCGGCASTGEGQDCTAIKGVWNVGCVQGRCSIYTCAAGYKRSRDGNSCVPS